MCPNPLKITNLLGSHIKKAKDMHIEINIEKAEPNQKWHLLISYYNELTD